MGGEQEVTPASGLGLPSPQQRNSTCGVIALGKQ